MENETTCYFNGVEISRFGLTFLDDDDWFPKVMAWVAQDTTWDSVTFLFPLGIPTEKLLAAPPSERMRSIFLPGGMDGITLQEVWIGPCPRGRAKKIGCVALPFARRAGAPLPGGGFYGGLPTQIGGAGPDGPAKSG